MNHRRVARLVSGAVALLGLVIMSLPGAYHAAPLESRHSRAPAGSGSPAVATGRLFAGRLLAYAFHGFTAPELQRITQAVKGTVAVSVGEAAVASGHPAYPVVPIEAMTTSPAGYAAVVGQPALATAMQRGAVLARTEAGLRHLRAGDTLLLADGRRIPVTAVVDDPVIGGLEMALPPAYVTMRHGTAASYVLLPASAGVPAAVRAAMRDRHVRIRSHTANGFFSDADIVLTQLQQKVLFGEFDVRPMADGSGFEQDPAYEATRLIWVPHVQQLGPVKCNRAVMAPLRAAMREITDRGLGATINTADFEYEGGCWNAKSIPLSGGSLSRHAWGTAVDINVATNQLGTPPHQDPRLIAVMRKYGFMWGGDFLRPDGMHFEYVGPAIARIGLH